MKKDFDRQLLQPFLVVCLSIWWNKTNEKKSKNKNKNSILNSKMLLQSCPYFIFVAKAATNITAFDGFINNLSDTSNKSSHLASLNVTVFKNRYNFMNIIQFVNGIILYIIVLLGRKVSLLLFSLIIELVANFYIFMTNYQLLLKDKTKIQKKNQ